MMRRITFGLLGICGVLMLAGCGIFGNLRMNPGYADFGSARIRGSERDLALSLGPLPLMLARRLSRDDPKALETLRDLKAIRVYTYRTDREFKKLRNRAKFTAAQLADRDWTPVLTVRESDGFVSALFRIDGDHVRGLAVIAQDQSELTLINLIGEIHPEMFGDYVAAFDVDDPNIAIEANAGTEGRARWRSVDCTLGSAHAGHAATCFL